METVNIKTDIKPGPSLPAQKTAFRKFLQRLIAEVQASYHDQTDDNFGRTTPPEEGTATLAPGGRPPGEGAEND